LDEIPGLVFEHENLARGGMLILEHPGKQLFSAHPRFFDQRKYGSVHFSFFR
jgi:hypothetical protein